MISLGLLGGISIVTVKLIENQANNEAHLKAKAEIMKATSLLKSIINDPASCRNMFLNQQLAVDMTTAMPIGSPPAIAPAVAPPAGLYQKIKISASNYGYKEILVPNAKYGLFRTGTIQLVKTSDNNTPTTILPTLLNPTTLTVDVDNVDLIVQFRLETKSILNAFRSDNNDSNDKTFLQRIPMMVTFNAAVVPNTIRDCGLITSEVNVAAKQKFCESLGNMALWDIDTQKCSFKSNKCPYGQVPDEQNSTAALFTCVNIVDKFKADDLFDTDPTGCTAGAGGFSVETHPGPGPNAGKLRIKCN